MVGINMEDVIGVLQTCQPYLIALGVLLALCVAVAVAAHWIGRPLRALVRGNTVVAAVASVTAIASMVCLGPMSTLIGLTMGSGQVSAETTREAGDLVETIAGEGFVMLKNDDGLLPLTDVTNINLFGWASENPAYAGGGSGGINELYDTVSIRQGLENAGFSVNQDLADFYAAYSERPEMSINKQSWSLPEPPVDTYPLDLIDGARQFSDVAVITISRAASEGQNDLPTDVSQANFDGNSDAYEDFEAGEHYLRLSRTEEDLVEMVCSNFDDVIVLINSANPMELGFIDDYDQIKSAIWCAGPGHVGFNALGGIFSGEINPSGRTTDTLVYDMTQAPWWNNAVKTDYSNMGDYTVEGMNAGVSQEFSPAFLDYAEGIYVGYKFYETAADEGLIDYETTVQYPFGYGLSYTTFEQRMSDIAENGDELSFSVTVTNTGDTAGKDVVEVYYDPPYTNGGIEKASANLLDEQKTDLLAPGASQTLEFTVAKDDLASYDYLDAKAWVLEAGDYTISINADAHTELDSRTYTVADEVVYRGDATHNGDETAATNEFDDVAGDVTYLSRADHFANYAEATAKADDELPDELRAEYHINENFDYSTYLDPDAEMPTTGADNGVQLADLRGVDVDDPQWDALLDEMSVQDMVDLTSLAGYQTAAVDSIGKVQVTDADGPAAINNNFTGAGSIGFPVATVIAQTWNPQLVQEYGEMMGRMCREMNIAGWYAPGVNIHRSPFGGRNYEFYSEDGVLSGIMATAAIEGCQSQGVYAFIKHFALYDGNSKMVCVWSNEQAIREIYLRPFEMGIKDGGAQALMVSWNYLGIKWAGENSSLLKTVLRDEWGFDGMAISDYFRDNGHGFMNADAALANGVDAMLSTYGSGPNVPRNTEDASTVQYMREASRHILYTVVNSWVYEDGDVTVGMEPWKMAVIGVDVAVGLLLVGAEVLLVRRYLRRRAA
ncbi:glycoside hydrolase family 3 protein [Bifidobacterium phasiani]|uniref:Glycoside hydrolase family 3 protein n=1 Tax=Bifidobacterium phasiani TaxID=2834431 RepID=A0ABS6W835_9BIFI|nr:glycoside hydrolase family 3 protein [Bifidobacterium phasiani]MBW3082355.1 glycoside hydrolase family 3 protein [Bifidobacterium phasiani]